MTRKEAVALRLAVIDLRVTLRQLDQAGPRAKELAEGHDNLSAIAIRAGVYGTTTDHAAKDLRRVLDDLADRFPELRTP